MNLPQDPILLMSVVNTLLRDQYANFDDLCDDKQLNKEEICTKLESVGYIYNPEQNQFR